jgi:hypothetical protein
VKDLYLKLGIDRGASAAEVQAALEIKPELSDYAMILMDTEKRALYDSTHSTLKMIGALRLRLGLDSGPSWFLKNYLDFAPAQKLANAAQNPVKNGIADTSASAHPAPQQPQSVASTPPAQSKLPAKWVVSAVLLIIGVLVIVVLLR